MSVYIMAMICIDVCILHIISLYNIMSILFLCVHIYIYLFFYVYIYIHIEDSHGASSENCERI